MKFTQYLSKNIKCLWNIIKEEEPINNYNIISCVFFKTKDFIRKDNIKYIDGLTNIINNFKKELPNYRLRIYYDNTVKDIINNITNNKLKDIELYEYDINFFRDGIYHKGLIGTYIRFLPLFDIKYHKVDKCIIFDIDNKIINNNFNKIINYFENNDIKFAYRCRFCYLLNQRIKCTKNKYPIIASFIYQSIQLPYKIFSNYLEKLYIKNNKKLIYKLNKGGITDIHNYGIDEFFLNKIYIKYINKNNIDFVLVLFNHIDIIKGFTKYLINYCKKKDIMNIWKIINSFFTIINIDFNKFYNNKEIKKEYILECFDKNVYFFNNKLLISLKNHKIKNKINIYISNQLIKNQFNKNLQILLNCILYNLNIKLNKINFAKIVNNKITYNYL